MNLNPLSLPAIPWLVQASQEEAKQLGPVWDIVRAPTSRQAALDYAATRPDLDETFFVSVAPYAAILRYDNGMPKFCVTFTCVRHNQCALAE